MLKVSFDYNLLDMQSKGLPAVVYEKKLLFSGQSVLSAAVVADSLEEAREIEQKVKKLPTVASVDGDDRGDPIFVLLTGDQTGKLKLVNEIKGEVGDLHFANDREDPLSIHATNTTDQAPEAIRQEDAVREVHLHELSATLYSTMGYLGQAEAFVKADQPDLAKRLLALRTAISDFRVKMLSDDRLVPQRLAEYQRALFDDIHQTFDGIKNQDTSSPLKPEDLSKSFPRTTSGNMRTRKNSSRTCGPLWRRTETKSPELLFNFTNTRRCSKTVTSTPRSTRWRPLPSWCCFIFDPSPA
jgi:hypothetical protein